MIKGAGAAIKWNKHNKCNLFEKAMCGNTRTEHINTGRTGTLNNSPSKTVGRVAGKTNVIWALLFVSVRSNPTHTPPLKKREKNVNGQVGSGAENPKPYTTQQSQKQNRLLKHQHLRCITKDGGLELWNVSIRRAGNSWVLAKEF